MRLPEIFLKMLRIFWRRSVKPIFMEQHSKLGLRLQDLEKIHAVLKKFLPGQKIWAFGSRVTGQQLKPFSDLDLVIMGDEVVSDEMLVRVQNAFEESDLPINVDLAVWKFLPQSLQAQIQKSHIELM
jgi:predicted nucleotidyltransferase